MVLSRAQVWPFESELPPLDGRTDDIARCQRCAGSHPDGAVVWTGAASREELVGVGRDSDDRLCRIREPDRSGVHSFRSMHDTVRADLRKPVVVSGASGRVGLHGMDGIGKSLLANALARARTTASRLFDPRRRLGCPMNLAPGSCVADGKCGRLRHDGSTGCKRSVL